MTEQNQKRLVSSIDSDAVGSERFYIHHFDGENGWTAGINVGYGTKCSGRGDSRLSAIHAVIAELNQYISRLESLREKIRDQAPVIHTKYDLQDCEVVRC